MLRALLITLFSCSLTACEQYPSAVSLAFSSYHSTPVVVTKFSLNDSKFGLLPMVVDGRADTMRPNEGTSRMDAPIGRSSGSSISVSAEWTEITTGKAWQGSLSVPVQQLAGIDSTRVEMMPVFGPDGLLTVTSDRAASGDLAARKVDLAQVCGSAVPGAVDYRADPGALPQLLETLQASRPPADTTVCSTR